MKSYDDIRKRILKFREDRDWKQFHDIKNLAEGVSIEAGELLSIFLWAKTEEAEARALEKLSEVEDEIADIFIFLVYLCDNLNIDLMKAVEQKIGKNEQKYPVELSRGSAKKYTELKP